MTLTIFVLTCDPLPLTSPHASGPIPLRDKRPLEVIIDHELTGNPSKNSEIDLSGGRFAVASCPLPERSSQFVVFATEATEFTEN